MVNSGVACVLELARVRGVTIEAKVFDVPSATDLRDASVLTRLATQGGLALAVVRAGIGDIRAARVPVIARGDDGEFFLIEALRDDGVVIAEPHRGERALLSLEAFTQRWSGVALLDTHVDSPEPAAVPTDPSQVHARRRLRRPATVVVLLLLTSVGAVLAWAATRTVEIAAWGTARIPPLPQAIEVSAPQAGSIRRVLVGDGDAAGPGDVLLELVVRASTPEEPDREAVIEAELDLARADAMLAAISLDAPPRLRALANVESSRRTIEERSLASRFEAYRANVSGLDGAIEKARAQRRVSEESIVTLREGVALAQKRAAEAKSLFDQGFISRNAYLEREERLVQLQRDLDKQTESAQAAATAVDDATAARQTLTLETRREFEADRREAQQRLSALRGAAARPKETEQVVALRASHGGEVQLRPEARLGAPVTAGQALARVQPALRIGEVVAMLEPVHAAQVRTGMPAALSRADAAPAVAPLDAIVIALSQPEPTTGEHSKAAGVQVTLRLERPVSTHSNADERAADVVLVPGSQLRVRIPVAKRSLLASWFDP